jgi:hypothetical protein
MQLHAQLKIFAHRMNGDDSGNYPFVSVFGMASPIRNTNAADGDDDTTGTGTGIGMCAFVDNKVRTTLPPSLPSHHIPPSSSSLPSFPLFLFAQ